MKKQILFASLIIAFSFATSSAIACPTPYAGPYYSGPWEWADYTQDGSCYNIAPLSSISCYSEPSWSFDTGSTLVSTSFTVGSSDFIADPTKWTLGSVIDFSSPGGTSADRFEIDVDVVHPNNTVSYYTVLFWSGSMGSISSCNGGYYTYFTANVGDTIFVYVGATKSSTGTIVVSLPSIFNANV